jgi:phosphopantetheinyl transferase
MSARGYAPSMLVVSFRTDLTHDELIELRRLLSSAEQARADRIIRPDAGRRFIVTRARLREELGAALDMPARDVPLHDRPRAAPELDAPLHFSVSHSADMALIAIRESGSIGVDIEQMRPRPRLNATPAFYADWTAAEARFKAGAPDACIERPPVPAGYVAAVALA